MSGVALFAWTYEAIAAGGSHACAGAAVAIGVFGAVVTLLIGADKAITTGSELTGAGTCAGVSVGCSKIALLTWSYEAIAAYGNPAHWGTGTVGAVVVAVVAFFPRFNDAIAAVLCAHELFARARGDEQ